MKKNPYEITLQRPPGRPREYVLTPEQERRYLQLVQLANVDADSGSAAMAWRVLCTEHPEIGWSVADLASKHTLPQVARDLARKANALVPRHRQGERGLRAGGAYVAGTMRRTRDGERRLRAGEHISYDDGTINVPVVIPWPLADCELSSKYGVKVGRFQLLCPHDEAASFIPSFEFVIRESQGYRATDAAGAALRFLRDVGKPASFVFEGGVWQGTRMMRVLESAGVGLVDVKGRPWQKLIENRFNTLWTRLAMEPGLASVGRHRGEEKAVSEFYVKCRGGKADPRGKFPWLQDLLDGLENSIRWLNEDRIESGAYGKWIPRVRWEADLAEQPMGTLSGDLLWLASPVAEERVVHRGMVGVTADGPLGVKMKYRFTGDCLWDREGRKVDVYFDPLAEWPLDAVIALPGKGKPLGRAVCANPYWEGGMGAEATNALRQVMRREYRRIWGPAGHFDVSKKETEIRGPEGVAAGESERGLVVCAGGERDSRLTIDNSQGEIADGRLPKAKPVKVESIRGSLLARAAAARSNPEAANF